MQNHRLKAVPVPRRTSCAACGIPLRVRWHSLCRECFYGARFFHAASDYLRAARR